MISVKYLLDCNKVSGRGGYSMFAKICYGNNGNLIVKAIIILNNFGLVCSYLRIFGDVISAIVSSFVEKSDNFFTKNWHNWFYILILAIIMITFIFKDNMDTLKVSFFCL